MKTISISPTYIMSKDGLYVDKCSFVSDEHLTSLLDSCSKFFSTMYLHSQVHKYYFIFKHVDFLRDLVGKVDASDICSSLNLYLKSLDIDNLSSSSYKLVVL